MVLPNGVSMPANQFFVAFDNADKARHSGHYHGFWGVAVATRTWQADGSVYINTALGRDQDRLALNIRQDIIQQVMARFRLKGHDHLRGKYVLAFGKPYVTNGGQFTLYVENPAHMAVIDPATVNVAP